MATLWQTARRVAKVGGVAYHERVFHAALIPEEFVEFGFSLPGRGPLATPEQVLRLATRADELRYDSIFVTDHVVLPVSAARSVYPYASSGQLPGGANQDYLDPLALLGWLAHATRRIRLGTSVLVLPYRNPLVTAKVLATIDRLSGGRLILGAGVGWLREEFEAVAAPPFEERGRVTDEYIRAFRELWSNERPSFQGKFVNFSNLIFLPKPVQKPGIPIWIGGHSKAALKRAGELGDGWHPIGGVPTIPLEPEDIKHDWQTMAEYATRAGRDPKTGLLCVRDLVSHQRTPPRTRIAVSSAMPTARTRAPFARLIA